MTTTTTTTTTQTTENGATTHAAGTTTHAPRVSLSRERLHFVTNRRTTSAQSPRMRLTSGLVGCR